MLKQTLTLLRLHLINMFGLNEARLSPDRKKRRTAILLICVYAYVVLLGCGYSAGCAFMLASSGAGESVMVMLFTLGFLSVLVLTLFIAGERVFSVKTYERLTALPVSRGSIVASHFLYLYIYSLALSVVTVLPGTVVYASLCGGGAAVILRTMLSLLFLPMIPLTVATALSALIYAVSSRMRRKAPIAVVLSLVVTAAVIVLSAWAPMMLEELGEAGLAEFISSVTNVVESVFYPAKAFSSFIDGGAILDGIIFFALSLGVFALLWFAVEKSYGAICRRLSGKAANRKFDIAEVRAATPLAAFFRKELRGYLSASMYVLNTGIGFIMMVAMAIALAIAGVDTIEASMEADGVIELALPYLLGIMAILSPMTSSCISFEGKSRWIPLSLPIPEKTIADAKIAVCVITGLPFLAVSAVICGFAVHPSFVSAIALLLPFVYLVFGSVVGYYVNIRNPLYEWENVTTVVKQSRAVLYTMLASFAACGIPAGIAFSVPKEIAPYVSLATILVLSAVTALIYKRATKIAIPDQ